MDPSNQYDAVCYQKSIVIYERRERDNTRTKYQVIDDGVKADVMARSVYHCSTVCEARRVSNGHLMDSILWERG